MKPEQHDAIDLRAYLVILRERMRLAAAVLALVTIAAAFYSFTRAPVYEATALVQIKLPPAAAANLPPVNLETERRVATSDELATAVAEDVTGDLGNDELLGALAVRQVPGAEILEFQVTLGEAELAADAANASAQAYVSYRRDEVQEALGRATQILEHRIAGAQQQLNRLNDEISAAAPNERSDLQERRAALLVQIGLLEQRLTDLQPETTAELTAARVIEEAQAPGTPAAPNHVLNLMLGLVLGLLVGILVAFAHYFWTTPASTET